MPFGPIWLDDTSLVALLTVRGRSIPWRFDLASHPEPLVDPSLRVIAAGVQAANGTLVVNAQVDGTSLELSAVQQGGLRRVTRNGAAWQRRFPHPRLEEIQLRGPAGPIQAWVYSP